MKGAQILKFKGCTELGNQGGQELSAVPSHHYVINIDKKIDHQFALLKNEQKGIS